MGLTGNFSLKLSLPTKYVMVKKQILKKMMYQILFQPFEDQ